MYKRAFGLFVALVLVLGIAAQAAEMRAPTTPISLTFSGTTANCSAQVETDKMTDTISGFLTLTNGPRVIATWPVRGSGLVSVNKTASVERGKTYVLTLTYSINGGEQKTAGISKTCP